MPGFYVGRGVRGYGSGIAGGLRLDERQVVFRYEKLTRAFSRGEIPCEFERRPRLSGCVGGAHHAA
jgi:hypothetical protein